jgi:pyruvate/2-oxoglutarate dehydrogenase complex dihydrolipoamide acyltransferase (E2) component
MRLAVRMPQFGESAAEATVVAWLVQPGASVNQDQEIVEVQTEKSILTVAAPAAGTLAEVCAQPGDKLAVGDTLAWLAVAGSEPAAPAPAAPAPPAAAPASAVPSDVHAIGAAPKSSVGLDAHRRKPVGAATVTTAKAHGLRQVRHGGGATVQAAGESSFVSPRVWTLLQQHGLKASDLSSITGTGAGGRITAKDVEHYASQGEPMSQVRQAVAAAMTRSWSRPLATVARSIRCDAILAHRRTVEGRPSLTIYGLKALALALKGSAFASRLSGSRLLIPGSIDLAVAVEYNDGVLTPVIRRVETRSMADLTAAVEDVIEKARTGRVADAGDAVGSVSNYGVFDITWATPIPLPGHGVILGLGSVRNAPDWNPATKSFDRIREAELTLTFDHRIADGGAAGRMLQTIVDLMENPARL